MANYYLCKGENLKYYWNVKLTKVFPDMKSLEEIDMFTKQYYCYSKIKNEMIEANLMSSLEDLVIATSKTDKKTNGKRLVPIFLKDLIFARDFELLNIEAQNYQELIKELWKYIKDRCNDKNFITFIINQYERKYSYSKSPIYEDGDLGVLKRYVNNPNIISKYRSEYEECFCNFFFNELYSCKIRYVDGRKIFVPDRNKINQKGLHDMLINILRYVKQPEYQVQEEIQEDKKIEEKKEEEGPTKKLTTGVQMEIGDLLK